MKRRAFIQCLGLLGGAATPMGRGVAQLIAAGIVRPPPLILVSVPGHVTEESAAAFLRFAAMQSALTDECWIVPMHARVELLP